MIVIMIVINDSYHVIGTFINYSNDCDAIIGQLADAHEISIII